jgi:hypothetical protein
MPNDLKFILGLDLDGVCADYYARIREVAAEWTDRALRELTTDITYGFPEWNLKKAGGKYPELHKFAVTQRDLFR